LQCGTTFQNTFCINIFNVKWFFESVRPYCQKQWSNMFCQTHIVFVGHYLLFIFQIRFASVKPLVKQFVKWTLYLSNQCSTHFFNQIFKTFCQIKFLFVLSFQFCSVKYSLHLSNHFVKSLCQISSVRYSLSNHLSNHLSNQFVKLVLSDTVCNCQTIFRLTSSNNLNSVKSLFSLQEQMFNTFC